MRPPDSTEPRPRHGPPQPRRCRRGPHPDRALDRRIAALALPALGSIAAEPAYNLADTAIVGHLGRVPLDSLAIAATAEVVAGLAAGRSPDGGPSPDGHQIGR